MSMVSVNSLYKKESKIKNLGAEVEVFILGVVSFQLLCMYCSLLEAYLTLLFFFFSYLSILPFAVFGSISYTIITNGL